MHVSDCSRMQQPLLQLSIVHLLIAPLRLFKAALQLQHIRREEGGTCLAVDEHALPAQVLRDLGGPRGALVRAAGHDNPVLRAWFGAPVRGLPLARRHPQRRRQLVRRHVHGACTGNTMPNMPSVPTPDKPGAAAMRPHTCYYTASAWIGLLQVCFREAGLESAGACCSLPQRMLRSRACTCASCCGRSGGRAPPGMLP